MPINNITQTISTLPPAGRRGIDVQTQFVIKQEDFQDHLQGTTVTELNTLKDQLNSRIGEINSTTTTMNGYANTASAGASTATTKAGEASTSAGEALSYRNQAETFKNNASASATKASQWSDNNYNVEVETGRYSAKHWSTVAQNIVNNKIDKVLSTDNAIVRFDGVTGQVQNSGVVIDDNNNVGIGISIPNSYANYTIVTQNGINGVEYDFALGGNLAGYLELTHTLFKLNAEGTREFQFISNGAERMRIDANGKLVFGSNVFGGRISITGDYAAYGENHIVMRNNLTTNYGNIIFQNAAGTQVGYIQASSTATAYVTSSDYRLKDDIKPMIGSIKRVMDLKPCNFVWKETGHRVDGFIAHELQEVVPEAATGVKDEMMEEEYEISPRVEATYDEESNELTPVVEAVIGKREIPKYQGIDQSKLVPLLTSALQDAILQIELLENRIEILEGAK